MCSPVGILIAARHRQHHEGIVAVAMARSLKAANSGAPLQRIRCLLVIHCFDHLQNKIQQETTCVTAIKPTDTT